MSEKLIRITKFNISLNSILGTSFTDFYVYRSKGLMTHLLNRNHYISAKIESYVSSGRLIRIKQSDHA